MATFSNIAVDEPTTVDLRVATITVTRGVTDEQQEIICLGDPDSSNALAAIVGSTPGSTAWGLVVRPVGDSTIAALSTGSVRVVQSSAAELNVTVAGYSTVTTVSTGSVRVHQSTAADLNVTVAGYSTVATISTGSVRVHQSTAADLNVTVAGYGSTSVNAGAPDAGTQRVIQATGSTASVANVTSSTSSVQLVAVNASRLGAIVYNDSTSGLFVKYGTSAASTSFTWKAGAGAAVFITQYSGIVHGAWESANGAARVTEIT